jgi:hypothetical protein
MIHYNYIFRLIQYDFTLPSSIYIVNTNIVWKFIEGQVLNLKLKKEDGEMIISFDFLNHGKKSKCWFFPYEILNKSIIEYLPEQRFKKLKAFL